jgi:hypothetical protein
MMMTLAPARDVDDRPAFAAAKAPFITALLASGAGESASGG